MTAPYLPTCAACRSSDPTTFRLGCQGCQARKARIDAARLSPPITAAQVAGMDSTFGELK